MIKDCLDIAATSAAKSVSTFSMPSPTSKWMKPVTSSVMLFQQLTNSFAWFHNERLTGQRNFAGEFLHAAFNHFLCDFFRLTRLHRDIQLYRYSFSTTSADTSSGLMNSGLLAATCIAMCLTSSSSAPLPSNQNADTRTVLIEPKRRLPAQQRGEC